jgi:small subunit ribosomal protein S9
MADEKKTTTKIEKKPKDPESVTSYYEAVGRRKVATAQVRLYVVKEEMTIDGITGKKGDVVVNGKSAEQYFPGEVFKKIYLEPFRTTNTMGRFVTSIHTSGGGLNGQLASVVLGISRALEKVDKERFRPILKKRKFLTRDPRARQRRKAGFAGKSRAKKQSPKR